MRVEPNGERIYLVWPAVANAAADEVTLHYEVLDSSAATLVEKDLDLPGGRLRSPQLLRGDASDLTLFWAGREDADTGWRLWVTSLDEDGTISNTPQVVTPEEMNVADYGAVQKRDGGQYLVWEDTRTDALYGLELSEGAGVNEVVELASGANPGLAVDETDNLHLVWQREEVLFYERYQPGSLAPTAGTQIADLTIGFANSFSGPVIDLTGEWAYVLWSIFSQTGLEAGTGRTEYIAFPLAEPQEVVPERLRIMPTEDQPYEPYAGEFPLTQLVPPPSSPGMNSDYVGEPAITSGPGSEAVAVVSTNQDWRQQTVVQLAAVLFDEGQPRGYQMAAKTQNVSQEAAIAADAAGNLYLAWNEGAGGLNAYFATTAPAMQDEINSLEAGDAANLLLTSGMEGVVGLLFLPMAVIWMLPGAVLTALWRLRRETEDSGNLGSRIVFVVAIVIYQIVKILFMPAIQTYVPFSAWLDIPGELREPLIVIVPLALLLFAIVVAEVVRRRREETSTPLYFFIVAGIDAVLTLIVYGVNFLGVF